MNTTRPALSALRQIVHTDNAPKAIGPYSQAVRVGNLLFVSGQVGLDPKTMQLQAGLQNQTKQVLENMKAILVAGGSSLESVVKTTVLLKDMGDFAEVNKIYSTYFPQSPPARACFAVAKLPLDALVEIECVAVAEQSNTPKSSL